MSAALASRSFTFIHNPFTAMGPLAAERLSRMGLQGHQGKSHESLDFNIELPAGTRGDAPENGTARRHGSAFDFGRRRAFGGVVVP